MRRHYLRKIKKSLPSLLVAAIFISVPLFAIYYAGAAMVEELRHAEKNPTGTGDLRSQLKAMERKNPAMAQSLKSSSLMAKASASG